MADKVIEIEGFDELLKALKDAPKTVMPFLKVAMTYSVRAIQSRVAEYPPSTASNQPGRMHMVTLKRKSGNVQVERPMGYYERGRGWWYPVLEHSIIQDAGRLAGAFSGKSKAVFGKTRGVIKAKKGAALAGYKLASGGTSEMMGRSWDAQVTTEKSAVLGMVGNNTSYVEYVQGGKQTSLHQAHEWKTLDQALEESQEDINKFFGQSVDEWIKREI